MSFYSAGEAGSASGAHGAGTGATPRGGGTRDRFAQATSSSGMVLNAAYHVPSALLIDTL